MKLLVFVTEDAVADAAVDALVEQGFRVTRLASSGGFSAVGRASVMACSSSPHHGPCCGAAPCPCLGAKGKE